MGILDRNNNIFPDMEPNPDDCSGETQQQDVKARIAYFKRLENDGGQPKQSTKHKSEKKGTKAETVLTEKTLPSAERSTVTFNEELKSKVDELSKKQTRASSPRPPKSPRPVRNQPYREKRFEDTFVEQLRARIDEASRSTNSGFSPGDMEVFKQPMCLVSTDDENMLKIEEQTVQEINAISWPLIIVAVVGLYRTGKSYLMNQLAGSKNGFALGNTIQSKTKGIWVWCVIHPQKQNTVLLLVDTEGLGDIEKGDSNHDNRIFSLATLLCNCLVYNMKGAFDQDAVSKLTFITEMTNNIRYRKTSSQENEYLNLILPEFVLCVRDFSLQLKKDDKKITEDEYLEGSLEEQKGKDDRFNKPRECIKKYFPERRCFTFPPPGGIEVLEKLETLSFDDLSDRFKNATTRFVSYIYRLKPKELIASKPVNGLMFTTLATHYVTAIRHGAIPDVDDAFHATTKIENKRMKDIALKIFEESLAAVELPIPSTQLEDIYTRAQLESLCYLRENVVHDKDGYYELTAQSAMDNIWNNLKNENADKILSLCQEKLEDAFKSLKENINKKVYDVAGGHRNFQRDVNRMKDKYMSSLRDFKEHEISWTWLRFLETLQTTESKIIETDEHLSGQEKEDERKRNEERIKELTKEHERSKEEVLEEQRKLLQEHYEKIAREREKQFEENIKKYTQVLEAKLEKEQLEKEKEKMEKERIELLKKEEKHKAELLEANKKVKIMQQEQNEKQQKWFWNRIIDAIRN